jgi:single-stranded-DNA-specific exonuclease
VAPLVGVNRAFVRQGLRVMARRERPGLVALCDAARLAQAPTAHTLGYVLGPRINAGGRIGAADLGARCLATADPAEAAALALRLDALNAERRAVEATVRAEALAQAEARGFDAPLVWAAGDGWHPGVVGIVAARLKEAADRPAVVIGIEGGIGKGSARSVAGVDLGAAVQRLADEGLLLKGGGHRMAAGLTVAADAIPAAMQRLSDLLARQGAGAGGPVTLHLDGLIDPAAASPDLLAEIDRAGPFGQAAPPPRFALPDLRVTDLRTLGEGHLKLRLVAPGGARIEAIAFGAADAALGRALATHGGRRIHAAGTLDLNQWQGRTTVQLRLDDAAFADAAPGGGT